MCNRMNPHRQSQSLPPCFTHRMQFTISATHTWLFSLYCTGAHLTSALAPFIDSDLVHQCSEDTDDPRPTHKHYLVASIRWRDTIKTWRTLSQCFVNRNTAVHARSPSGQVSPSRSVWLVRLLAAIWVYNLEPLLDPLLSLSYRAVGSKAVL